MRAAASLLAAVAGCLLAVVSVLAVWARDEALDTDRYVDSVRPLASERVTQDEVASRVTDALTRRLRRVVPGGAATVRPLVAAQTEAFTRGPEFEKLWVEVNRTAHEQVVALLRDDDDGRVRLDLGLVVAAVRDQLVAAGLPAAAALPKVRLVVDVADARDVQRARHATRLLDDLARWLPWVALGLLVAGVALARHRLRALALTGLGVAVLSGLAWLAVRAVEGLVAEHRPAEISEEIARAFYDAVTTRLDRLLLIGLVAGLAVAVAAALLAGLRSRREGATSADL